MQKWLEDNDILMYSIHDEGNSVVGKSLIRSLNGKAYKKKMTDDNSKSYIGCLKLVYEYNNTNHHSIGKIIVLLLLKKLNRAINPLNLVIDSGLINTRIILEKFPPKFDLEKNFLLFLCWKKSFGSVKVMI